MEFLNIELYIVLKNELILSVFSDIFISLPV